MVHPPHPPFDFVHRGESASLRRTGRESRARSAAQRPLLRGESSGPQITPVWPKGGLTSALTLLEKLEKLEIFWGKKKKKKKKRRENAQKAGFFSFFFFTIGHPKFWGKTTDRATSMDMSFSPTEKKNFFFEHRPCQGENFFFFFFS